MARAIEIRTKHISRIRALHHRPPPLGIGLLAVFVVLYAIVLQWCISTSGEPYAEAVTAYQKLYEDQFGEQWEFGEWGGGSAEESLFGEVDEDGDSAWGEEEEEAPRGRSHAVEKDVEEEVVVADAAASTESAEVIKPTTLRESAEMNNINIPHESMPNFFAVLALGVVFVASCLVMFVQRWSLNLKCRLQYSEASAGLRQNVWALCIPPEHHGKGEIVRVQRSKSGQLFFMFQRQRFEVDEQNQVVAEVRCPVDLPLSDYASQGLTSQTDIDRALDRFGNNSLHIPMLKFLDIYVDQMLGPVPVFQLFSSMLWLLDTYWNYALFHIFTIFMFEASTTWQRLRNLKQLRGMQQKSDSVRVYRCRQWATVPSEDLLPGDIVSLLREEKKEGGMGAAAVIPCDCLLLRGQAVVNEASMTGESVPQMKESVVLTSTSAGVALDMDNEHKMHVLFSGTTLTKHTAPVEGKHGSSSGDADDVPYCPQGGCVAYVLRTGFASSQGKLVRMIEYSNEKVMSDVKETMALLFLLLIFALMASGYVMKKGLEEGRRTKYDLVLRCVLIITSVVPPDLPMQTAVAVNTAIMALHKASVFCTEPFRIPYAGRIDVAFFDKTGTLTADELQAQGTANFSSSSSSSSVGGVVPLTAMTEASPEIDIVLGSCHSLVDVGGKVAGDPIEMAALKAVGWRYDSRTQIATNTPAPVAPASSSGNATSTKQLENKSSSSSSSSTQPKTKPKTETAHVLLLHRYHFSSKLQRMSVLAKVKRSQKRGGVAEATNQFWCISKGSPEAIKKLLRLVPAEYDDTYTQLAENGYRVLALAYRELSKKEADVAQNAQRTGTSSPREEVERDLSFAGFVAFACRVRRDTAVVVRDLQRGSTQVIMVTGDAALTALHVGVETGIALRSNKSQENCMGLLLHGETTEELEWRPARRSNANSLDWAPTAFNARDLPQLAREFDLVITGKTLRVVLTLPEAHDVLQHIVIYARCSPADKEAVLRILKAKGHHTLMCGDGANDVGALKQAHIGLALLSGFGQINVGKEGDKRLEDETELEKKARIKEEAAKRKIKATQMKKDGARIRAEMKEFQQKVYHEEVKRLEAKGESFAAVKAIKSSMALMMEEQKRRMKELGHGGGSLTGQASAMAALEDMDSGDMPVIKVGDASVAAPFTSKLPSIKSAVDIVRQGRCTLVSTIQMQQIMALNCLIVAYSLSAMYLDNVRSGEKQMIASGVCLMVASIAFSYARPVQELSPVKPITTIFHPAIWVSTAGQLLIHLACMVYMINLTSAVQDGPDERYTRPDIVKSRTLVIDEETGEEKLPPFQPTLLNTVVWLVETAQQVSVMAVNYKGRPFMLAATENKSMLLSLLALTVAVFVAAYEVVPELNEYLELVPLPDADFRQKLLVTLAVSVFGSFVWDRVCGFIFARELLIVGTMDAVAHLPTWKDMREGAGKYGLYGVMGGILLFADIGPMMAIGLYFLYKRVTKKADE